jgi:hypothetical protein
LILQRHPAAPIYLCHHILSVLQRLGEVTDRAYDVFVAVNAQRDDGNEAECEPGIALDHSGGPVPLIAVSDEEAMAWWDAAYTVMALT